MKHVLRFGKIVSAASAIIGAGTVAFGLSPLQSLILILLLALAITVFLYRTIVERRLSSAYAVIGFAAIVFAITALYDRVTSAVVNRTLWKTTGIVEYARNANDFLPRLRELIADAREDIWFAGVSFYISLPANEEFLLEALERGVNVRFLVYNPLSANLSEVATGFSQSPEALRSESDMTIRNLISLEDKAKQRGARGKLDVRLFTVVPKMRLYVIDRYSENGITFFIPHVDHQNTPNTPGLLARNLKTGIAPAFVDGMDRVWSTAMPWDTFLSTYNTAPKS